VNSGSSAFRVERSCAVSHLHVRSVPTGAALITLREPVSLMAMMAFVVSSWNTSTPIRLASTKSIFPPGRTFRSCP
jgi:hypothetical protein